MSEQVKKGMCAQTIAATQVYHVEIFSSPALMIVAGKLLYRDPDYAGLKEGDDDDLADELLIGYEEGVSWPIKFAERSPSGRISGKSRAACEGCQQSLEETWHPAFSDARSKSLRSFGQTPVQDGAVWQIEARLPHQPELAGYN